MVLNRLAENHPMMAMLAKELAAQQPAEYQELLFHTVHLLGVVLSQGHVCAALPRYAGTQALADLDCDYLFPELDEWLIALQQLDCVDDRIQSDSQLVLDHQRLYLGKYADWEQRLAEVLKWRCGAGSVENVIASRSKGDMDWQQVAADNSLLSPLSIIVGGPGTGKTTTVAKILQQLLLQEGHDEYRVALAAPTGKAAARMALALQEKLDEMALPAELKACVPEQAQTIHRLLGWSQRQRRFRFNSQQPLLLDCLIVDEASMIDMAMFVALLEALPEQCRVILLGDPFQLASVQAGNVLAEICAPEALAHFSPQRCRQLALAEHYQSTASIPLLDNIVYLQKSYRFSDDAGIGLLARATLDGDSQKLRYALTQPEISHYPKGEGSDAILQRTLQHYRYVAAADDIEQAFERLAEYQLLAAIKQGDYSTSFYNQHLQQQIGWQQSIGNEPVYHAMPVMMNSNHYALGLFNGDVGLLWQRENQPLYIFFKTADGELKSFLPSQIQGWQCAHAMTVHKSQGSEYNEVALVLPDRDSPLLTREMFYTAVTRTKQHFYCLASLLELEQAVQSPTERHSGLAQRLTA